LYSFFSSSSSSYLRSPSGGGVICFNDFLTLVVLFCSALCNSLEREKEMSGLLFLIQILKGKSKEK
jgi:hypothetical protein